MKTLSGLNEYLKPPNDRNKDKVVPSYMDVIVDSLMYVKPKDGSESIRLLNLANKMLANFKEVSLEDHDFLLVKQIVNSNPAGYFAWAHGQTMQKIINCETSNGR